MKKILFFATFVVMLLSGCSSNEPEMPTLKNAESASVQIRSIDDAVSIANQFAALSAKTGARSASDLRVDMSSIETICSRNSRSGNDTLMYAINYEDNNGFILVSANRATTPILAVIDKGNYKNSKKNEGFDYFMSAAKDYLGSFAYMKVRSRNSGDSGDGPVDKIMEYYDDTLRNISFTPPAKIQVEWGKDWPENIYSSNKNAGCGPVALAQVMTYFRPNTNIALTFDGRPSNNLNINWTEVIKHQTSLVIQNPTDFEKSQHGLGCDAAQSTHTEIAALVRQIGALSQTEYIQEGTFTDRSGLVKAAKTLLPSVLCSPIESSQLYEELTNSGVAILIGVSKYGSVHFWIADQTGYNKVSITTYYDYNPKTGEYSYSEQREDMSYYLHYNWGLSGDKNGYFLKDVFDTEKGIGRSANNPSRTDYGFMVSGYLFR